MSERGVFEPEMSEEDIVGQIRAMLEANGARVFRSVERVPKCYRCGQWLGASEVGIPDLWGWFPKPTKSHPGLVFPLHFYIECKRNDKSKVRPSQERFLYLAQQDGLLAFKASSWQDCLNVFRGRGIRLAVE